MPAVDKDADQTRTSEVPMPHCPPLISERYGVGMHL